METDVLIVGAGVAGLYAALNLNRNIKAIVASKDDDLNCNTYLAQGGISVARGRDDIEDFVEDTLKAGQYKNNVEAVKVLAKESMEDIETLNSFHVPFDKDQSGYIYTKEGAHRKPRIVHCKDRTGKEVLEVLIKEVKKRENIKIINNAFLVGLIIDENSCYGGNFICKEENINIYSKDTILATGGIGGIFKNSTNQRIMTGDGVALAMKNNIEVENLGYIQFHPTALYEENSEEKKFLISESLRGEGAILKNVYGERFVDELLPRDVVSKAIYKEEEKTNTPYVLLDISFKPREYLINRFPTIYKKCLENNMDITKGPIKVSPVQHYFMGGIKVDLLSRTSMNNLYACGETSSTGVHGANRLASNSLLEGLVFSRRASENINKTIDSSKLKKIASHDFNKDAKFYEEENKSLLIKEILKEREDIKNELSFS